MFHKKIVAPVPTAASSRVATAMCCAYSRCVDLLRVGLVVVLLVATPNQRPLLAADSAASESAIAPATATQFDPSLATVNGREIRESDVYAEIESLTLGDQVTVRQAFGQFAESVIREEILFQYLIATDFRSESALRAQLKSTALNHLIDKHVTSKISVTDDDIKKFYDENQSSIRGENLRASQIVLADRADCQALVQELLSDDDFASVASARSLDAESAARGGDIGYMMPHSGPYGFEEQLFELSLGEQTVIATDDEVCRVVRITERETPPLPALADVRDRIQDLIFRQRQADLLAELLEQAEQEVTVVRAKDSSGAN